MKNVSHFSMLLLMNTMRSFHYNATDKAKHYEAITKMQQKRVVAKVKQRFSSVDTSFSRQGILGENALSDPPRKRKLRNKKDRSSAQKLEIFNNENLEVPALRR